MAKLEDGWLSREMGGQVGSAYAFCYGSTLGSRRDIPQRIINGRHWQGQGVADFSSPLKKLCHISSVMIAGYYIKR